jgi:hypothetical protein
VAAEDCSRGVSFIEKPLAALVGRIHDLEIAQSPDAVTGCAKGLFDRQAPRKNKLLRKYSVGKSKGENRSLLR